MCDKRMDTVLKQPIVTFTNITTTEERVVRKRTMKFRVSGNTVVGGLYTYYCHVTCVN